MGNCMRHEESSSANWGGEDWGYLANDDRDHHKHTRKTKKREEVEEEDRLLKKKAQVVVVVEGGGAPTEVKIKMTKKELEELMDRVELKQMTVQQVLAQLIMTVSRSGESYERDHQRPWRPVLQSIPEFN